MRGSRIPSWLFQTAVCAFGVLILVLITLELRLGHSRGELSVDYLLDLSPVLVFGLAALVWTGVFLVRLPRYWAKQGITVDDLGISVAAEPLWWFRGHRAHVAWADVHHIAQSRRGRNPKHFRVVVEVHLSRVDHEPGLPAWAALVPSGRLKWGVTPSRPALLIEVRSRSLAVDLLSVLSAGREDLVEDAHPVWGEQTWNTP